MTEEAGLSTIARAGCFELDLVQPVRPRRRGGRSFGLASGMKGIRGTRLM